MDALAPLLTRPCLVVGKSTVPVGTSEMLTERLARLAPVGAAAEVAWNPEFLREGHAVADTMRPDRIVVGVRSARAEAMLREVYAAAGRRGAVPGDRPAHGRTGQGGSQRVPGHQGLVHQRDGRGLRGGRRRRRPLAQALSLDERIGGRFLVPGLGFGGGCLPKDIRAFGARTRELGITSVSSLLGEVDAINLRRRARMVDLALELAGGSLDGRAVGVLGCSFKPNSDDIRDSPALDIAGTVHGLGARVTVYDPAAMDRARQVHPELEYAGSMLEAADGADVLLLLTEWREFVDADPEVVGQAVAQRNIADGRSALDAGRWRAAGWRYRALGRPDATASADSVTMTG